MKWLCQFPVLVSSYNEKKGEMFDTEQEIPLNNLVIH